MDERKPATRSFVAKIVDVLGTVLFGLALLGVGLYLFILVVEAHLHNLIPKPIEVAFGLLAGSWFIWLVVRRINRNPKRPPDPP